MSSTSLKCRYSEPGAKPIFLASVRTEKPSIPPFDIIDSAAVRTSRRISSLLYSALRAIALAFGRITEQCSFYTYVGVWQDPFNALNKKRGGHRRLVADLVAGARLAQPPSTNFSMLLSWSSGVLAI